MARIRVLRIRENEKKVSAALEEMEHQDLDKGKVLVRVAYSGINYKDALAATGAGRIIRRFPCVGGIDLSGTVVESGDDRFKPGDAVIATSYDIGVAHDGGYAEMARLPADWVVPLPEGLSLFDAMALGTAGYTAALGMVRMELNGLKPENGPVIVTGATGGVGSIAVDILAGRGFKVAALTGKASEESYLKELGAAEIIDRKSVDLAKIRPLEKPRWAGAVDNLGGEYLSWLASSMQMSGTIASIGLAAGMDFKSTVAPFILRGVCLLGIDSGFTPMSLRKEVWRRLATDLRPRRLGQMTRTIGFDELPGAFAAFIDGKVRGRTVVKVGG
jgi:putative YhdH/YhfP family quinone oxidoreductase